MLPPCPVEALDAATGPGADHVLARHDRGQRGGPRQAHQRLQRVAVQGAGDPHQPGWLRAEHREVQDRPRPTTGRPSCRCRSTRCSSWPTRTPSSRSSPASTPRTTTCRTSSPGPPPTTRCGARCRACPSTSRTRSCTTTGPPSSRPASIPTIRRPASRSCARPARSSCDSGAVKYGLALDHSIDGGGGWFLEQWLAKADELYANNENGRAAPATNVLFAGAAGVELMTFLQQMVDRRAGHRRRSQHVASRQPAEAGRPRSRRA